MDDDPFRIFAAWWQEQNLPMVLATAGPTARAVVLEEFDERGFVFWTSSESPKARALADDPRVALVWLWEGRQARVEGRVEPVSDEENERHWQQREGKRQIAAFRQSEPIESREALLARLAAVPRLRSGRLSGGGIGWCPNGSSSGSPMRITCTTGSSTCAPPTGWGRRQLQPSSS